MLNNINLLENALITEDNLFLLEENKKFDYNIKFLLGRSLTQSQCIKFGKVFERFVKNILQNKNIYVIEETLFDIYQTNSVSAKNKKDVDLLFIFNDILYYFELKTSTFLDSEKSKQTDKKIKDITSYFENIKETYKCKSIVSGCLTCWFEYEQKMKNTLKSRVYYMSDFFNIINVNISKDDYMKLFRKLGTMIK